MDKEPRFTPNDSIEPSPSLYWLALETFEFVHGPSDEVLVDAPHKEAQLRAIEGSVKVDPASDLRIDLLGKAGQVRSAATLEVPGPDLLALCPLRTGTH